MRKEITVNYYICANESCREIFLLDNNCLRNKKRTLICNICNSPLEACIYNRQSWEKDNRYIAPGKFPERKEFDKKIEKCNKNFYEEVYKPVREVKQSDETKGKKLKRKLSNEEHNNARKIRRLGSIVDGKEGIKFSKNIQNIHKNGKTISKNNFYQGKFKGDNVLNPNKLPEGKHVTKLDASVYNVTGSFESMYDNKNFEIKSIHGAKPAVRKAGGMKVYQIEPQAYVDTTFNPPCSILNKICQLLMSINQDKKSDEIQAMWAGGSLFISANMSDYIESLTDDCIKAGSLKNYINNKDIRKTLSSQTLSTDIFNRAKELHIKIKNQDSLNPLKRNFYSSYADVVEDIIEAADKSDVKKLIVTAPENKSVKSGHKARKPLDPKYSFLQLRVGSCIMQDGEASIVDNLNIEKGKVYIVVPRYSKVIREKEIKNFLLTKQTYHAEQLFYPIATKLHINGKITDQFPAFLGGLKNACQGCYIVMKELNSNMNNNLKTFSCWHGMVWGPSFMRISVKSLQDYVDNESPNERHAGVVRGRSLTTCTDNLMSPPNTPPGTPDFTRENKLKGKVKRKLELI